ncbi:MAG: hypothetical protein R3C60_00820 [Parvularculaceae bacterium]
MADRTGWDGSRFAPLRGEMSFDAAASALNAVHLTTFERAFDTAVQKWARKPARHARLRRARGVPGYATPMGFIATDGENEKLEEIVTSFRVDCIYRAGRFRHKPRPFSSPGGIAGACWLLR